eukprot:362649-Chlamydomonas_euryale.AAC.3
MHWGLWQGRTQAIASMRCLSETLCNSSPQPENIYQFGAEYFANLKASGANGALSDMGAATKMGPHEGLETGIKAAVQSSEIGSMSTNELEPILMRE